MKHLVYYGQNREDLVLLAFFPKQKKGYYVDVGACDPIKYSVTKLFYEKGWRGINIEPQSRAFEALKSDRPRDINENIGVSDKQGTITLREYENESLSTSNKKVQKAYHDSEHYRNIKYTDREIEVYTLKQVFEKNKVASIQFLKVDVEGSEYEVMKGNDWNKYRPEVICIEANVYADNSKWQSLLRKNNYQKVFFDGLNEYYVDKFEPKNDFLENYQRLVVTQPTLSFDWEAQLQRVVTQLERVQATLDVQMAKKDKKTSQMLRRVIKKLKISSA